MTTPAQAAPHDAPTPESVAALIAELSPYVYEAIVLDAAGERLAGSAALTTPARELLAVTDAPDIDVSAARGRVFATRTRSHALVVVAARTALPASVLYDMRMLLAELEAAA